MKNNDEGSIGVITSFFLLLAIVAFVFLLFGGMIDQLISTSIQISANGGPQSALRNSTLNLLLVTWRAFPVMMMFVSGLFAIKSATREASGETL